MNDMYKDVKEFHEKFNLPVAGNEPCRIPDYLTIEYRTKFLEEELQEFKDAAAAGNLVEMLDALADIAWVALGTAHYFKAPFDEVWNEVKRANMTKCLQSQLPPGAEGDAKQIHKRGMKEVIRKPPGWEGPQIQQLLAQHNRVMKLRKFDANEMPGFGGQARLRDEAFKVVDMPDVELPIVGVINVDNPADPRHKEILDIPDFLRQQPSVEDKHPFGCDCDICGRGI